MRESLPDSFGRLKLVNFGGFDWDMGPGIASPKNSRVQCQMQMPRKVLACNSTYLSHAAMKSR